MTMNPTFPLIAMAVVCLTLPARSTETQESVVAPVVLSEAPLQLAASPAATSPRRTATQRAQRARVRADTTAVRDTATPDTHAATPDSSAKAGGKETRVIDGPPPHPSESEGRTTSTETATSVESPAASAAETPPVLLVNAARPGERLSADSFVVPGKMTIFDFYSKFCPPCMQIAPYLEELAKRRPDIVVRKVDINRTGIRGIDWGSPLARQYGLQSIPHFKIYGTDGQLVSEGDPAFQRILAYFKEAGIME